MPSRSRVSVPDFAAQRARFSTRALAGLLALGGALGCGEEQVFEPDPVPTADEVRSFFGLVDDACVEFYDTATTVLPATMSVYPPSTALLAGRTTYRIALKRPGQGYLEFLDVEAQDDGELRLLRMEVTAPGGSQRESVRYHCSTIDPDQPCPDRDAAEPVVLKLAYDEAGALTIAENSFEVVTTPMIQLGTAAEARSTVVETVRTTVTTGVSTRAPYTGVTEQGVQIRLTRDVAGVESVIRLKLVPYAGITEILIDGSTYQSCDWRVCDLAGNCVGADSCTTLQCS